MNLVLEVFAGLMGFVCLGFLAGRCYEHSRTVRKIHEEADAAYRQGLQRGRSECRAVQEGQVNYRSLPRARVKLHDFRRGGQ